MDLNIILSEKGKRIVVINNYKYSFQKILKSGEKRWTCINKKCRSYLLSMGEVDNVTVTKHVKDHCHNANVEQLNRQIVSTSCKRKASLQKSSAGSFKKICLQRSIRQTLR